MTKQISDNKFGYVDYDMALRYYKENGNYVEAIKLINFMFRSSSESYIKLLLEAVYRLDFEFVVFLTSIERQDHFGLPPPVTWQEIKRFGSQLRGSDQVFALEEDDFTDRTKYGTSRTMASLFDHISKHVRSEELRKKIMKAYGLEKSIEEFAQQLKKEGENIEGGNPLYAGKYSNREDFKRVAEVVKGIKTKIQERIDNQFSEIKKTSQEKSLQEIAEFKKCEAMQKTKFDSTIKSFIAITTILMFGKFLLKEKSSTLVNSGLLAILVIIVAQVLASRLKGRSYSDAFIGIADAVQGMIGRVNFSIWYSSKSKSENTPLISVTNQAGGIPVNTQINANTHIKTSVI